MLGCRAAQDNGDFAEAFHLCSQCAAYMQSVQQLQVSQQLTETVHTLQHQTNLRLHNALQAACTDFKPEHYGKVKGSFSLCSCASNPIPVVVLAKCEHALGGLHNAKRL